LAPLVQALCEATFSFECRGLRVDLAVEQVVLKVQERERRIGHQFVCTGYGSALTATD